MTAMETAMESPSAMSATEKRMNIGDTERWVSVFGGLALTIYGMTRKSLSAQSLSVAGGYLVYRGATGHCALYQALGVNTRTVGGGVSIERRITINRSPEEVYRFWHNFENLPRFMEHLESVLVLDNRRSHWVASVPGGIKFEWDAEMTEDIPNERISWRSLPEAEVQNQGSVEFVKTAAGTELMFKAKYVLPGVESGASSKLFQYISEKQLEKELLQFKNIIESGELRRAA